MGAFFGALASGIKNFGIDQAKDLKRSLADPKSWTGQQDQASMPPAGTAAPAQMAQGPGYMPAPDQNSMPFPQADPRMIGKTAPVRIVS